MIFNTVYSINSQLLIVYVKNNDGGYPFCIEYKYPN